MTIAAKTALEVTEGQAVAAAPTATVTAELAQGVAAVAAVKAGVPLSTALEKAGASAALTKEWRVR